MAPMTRSVFKKESAHLKAPKATLNGQRKVKARSRRKPRSIGSSKKSKASSNRRRSGLASRLTGYSPTLPRNDARSHKFASEMLNHSTNGPVSPIRPSWNELVKHVFTMVRARDYGARLQGIYQELKAIGHAVELREAAELLKPVMEVLQQIDQAAVAKLQPQMDVLDAVLCG